MWRFNLLQIDLSILFLLKELLFIINSGWLNIFLFSVVQCRARGVPDVLIKTIKSRPIFDQFKSFEQFMSEFK